MASGEDDLISLYLRPLATDPGALGLRDDAAILKSSDEDIVVTADAIVEGVHFLKDDPPDTIARKALRVNLSDLAAKGAVPAGFVLTLALREAKHDWLAPFSRALSEDAAQYGCPLLGGDTVSTPGPLMISITAFGRVPSGKMVPRGGAKVGDRVAVTGTIGDAALGLRLLQNKLSDEWLGQTGRNFLIGRYRTPLPRNALALAIRNHASAAMDVSDGLAGDLAKLCLESGATAIVEANAIPLSDAARVVLGKGVSIENLIAGGDDYEVLCAIPENRWTSFVASVKDAGGAVTQIGVIVSGRTAPLFRDQAGEPIPLKRLSYSHF